MKAGLFYLEFLRDVVWRVGGEDEDGDLGETMANSPPGSQKGGGKVSAKARKRKYATLDKKMKDLKKTLEQVLLPKLEKNELEKRLREFYKEQKDKEGLRDLKQTVNEYADKQHELFKILSKSYPGSDLSWFTNDPELYKLSKGKTPTKKDKNGGLDSYIPTGYAHTLNPQQETALKSLWLSFEDTEYYDFLTAKETNPEGDALLLRFLRATMRGKGVKGKRVFQVDQARERLVKTIKWKQVHAPQYEPENFGEFRRVKPSYVYADDLLKTLVVIEKTGRFWANADPDHFSDEEWALNFAYGLEKLEEKRRLVQQEIGASDDQGIIVIQDVKGLAVTAKKCLDIFKIYNQIAGDNYPELVRKVYVVNAPWIFARVFGVVKAFVDPNTIAKVEVHRGIPKKQFSHIFNLEQLPQEYGGLSTEFVRATSFYEEVPEL